MLNYKKEIPEMTDLLALYSSVGWTNYTKQSNHVGRSCQSQSLAVGSL